MSIASEITRLQNAKASIKTSIENKGVVVPSATTLDNYSTLIDDIQTGGGIEEKIENDVIFIDYDGKILYSYSKNEFLNLTELPANPTHEGLTSEGWNWTLSEAKSYVQNYTELVIGQLYITDDGKTRFYLRIPYGSGADLQIRFTQSKASGVLIDWGDGNTQRSANSTSDTTYSHNYGTNGGVYILTLSPDNDTNIVFTNNVSFIKNIDGYSAGYVLEKMELGKNLSLSNEAIFNGNAYLETITMPRYINGLGSHSIKNCTKLKSITISPNVSKLWYNIFQNDSSLEYISLPNTITQIASYTFASCSNLKRLNLPSTLTNLYEQVFNYTSYYISKVYFPKSLTSIDKNNKFGSTYTKLYDFTKHEAVPTLGTGCFSIYSTGKIVVPDNLYSTWITKSNWSNLSSYIVRASDYYGN